MKALTQVFRLENQGKMAEAATKRKGIFTGKVFSIRHRRTHRHCHHRCCRPAADTSAADVVGSPAAAAVAVAVAIASANAIAAADAAADVVAAARDTPGASPLTAVDGGMVRVRWQTDSFVAIFSAETKPSAEIYGL
jgi:hypothetical protein